MRQKLIAILLALLLFLGLSLPVFTVGEIHVEVQPDWLVCDQTSAIIDTVAGATHHFTLGKLNKDDGQTQDITVLQAELTTSNDMTYSVPTHADNESSEDYILLGDAVFKMNSTYGVTRPFTITPMTVGDNQQIVLSLTYRLAHTQLELYQEFIFNFNVSESTKPTIGAVIETKNKVEIPTTIGIGDNLIQLEGNAEVFNQDNNTILNDINFNIPATATDGEFESEVESTGIKVTHNHGVFTIEVVDFQQFSTYIETNSTGLDPQPSDSVPAKVHFHFVAHATLGGASGSMGGTDEGVTATQANMMVSETEVAPPIPPIPPIPPTPPSPPPYDGDSGIDTESSIVIDTGVTGTEIELGTGVTNITNPRLIVWELPVWSETTTEFEAATPEYSLVKTFMINLYDFTTKVTQVEGGTVRVSIPFIGDLDTNYVVLRHNDDKTVTDFHTSYIDGEIVFETDHFSTYAIAVKTELPQPVQPSTPPYTGVEGVVAIAYSTVVKLVVALILILSIVELVCVGRLKRVK